MKTNLTDEIYKYKGLGNCESMCGLRILLTNSGITIVVLRELAENPGTSITNCYEKIATQIYQELLKDKKIDKILWIEQYDKNSYIDDNDGKETLSQIFLNWDTDRQRFQLPKWQICSQEIRAMVEACE